jgi:hypothetical protein
LGIFGAARGGCVEACTIRIQLINSTARGVLALSEVVLTAKDQTVMQYSALIANLSTTRVSVASCFDNNNNTGCSTALNDTNASLTINYPCYRGLSAVRIINLVECCSEFIKLFKLVFVKSPAGTTPTADYPFTSIMKTYLIPGPSA